MPIQGEIDAVKSEIADVEEKRVQLMKKLSDLLKGTAMVVPAINPIDLYPMFASFHLSQFVEYGPDDQQTVVQDNMPKAGCFLKLCLPNGEPNDVPGSKLVYVRQDFIELFDEFKADLREQENVTSVGEEEQEVLTFWKLFLGQPGTGKTMLGLGLLFAFVKLGYTVVYHKAKLGSGYLVFKNKKLDSVGSRGEVQIYLGSTRTIFINDGCPVEGVDNVKANTLLITSPDTDIYKDFAKTSQGHETFYGRLWSEQELKECHARAFSKRLKWEDVLLHIYYAGYIPRLVFQQPKRFKMIKTTVKSEIMKQEHLVSVFSLIGPHNFDSKFSHKIVHLDRGFDSTQGYTRLGFKFIKEQLLLRLDVQHWRDAVLSYRRLQCVNALADFRGGIMELLMHLTFPKFLTDCEQIQPPTQTPKPTTRARAKSAGAVNSIPPKSQMLVVDEEEDLHVFFYSSFEDLEAKIKECLGKGVKAAYFWPRLQTEAAIDSLFIDFKREVAYLLQSTLAKRHPVVWHPVHKMVTFLSAAGIQVAGLYFVTSATNYAAFGYQTWKNKQKLHGEHLDKLTLPALPQYKIKFQMLDSDMENIEELQKFAAGIDENLKLFVRNEGGDIPEECIRKRKLSTLGSKDDVSCLV